MTTGATGNRDLHHRDLHLCLLASWKPQFKGDTCAQTKCSNILYTPSWMLLNALTIAIRGLTAEVIHDGCELLLLRLHRCVCPSRRRVQCSRLLQHRCVGERRTRRETIISLTKPPQPPQSSAALRSPNMLTLYCHLHLKHPVHKSWRHVHVHDLYFTWMCCLNSWCFMK